MREARRLDLASPATEELFACSRLLEEAWKRASEAGRLAYDPARALFCEAAPLRFLYLPGRQTRPRARISPEARISLRRPHVHCAFDSQTFLDEREAFRAGRQGRNYHLVFNKYPVLPLHFLAVRAAWEPAETLPQTIHGAAELEDMLLLATSLGPPFHLVFNSNRGADGSLSGSSVNHWHFQIFPWSWGPAEDALRLEASGGEVERGAAIGWPAHHALFRSRSACALAESLWSSIERITRQDSAFNLEIVPLSDRSLLAFLFHRAPVGDLVLPDGSQLSKDFGGFELTGGVVVPTQQGFEWVTQNQREAVALVFERLMSSTIAGP